MKTHTRTKQTVSLIIAILLMLGCVSMMTVHAADAKSGKCGDSLEWKIDSEGTLTISGTGKMYDYKKRADVPWKSYYKKDIKNLVVEDGVEHIGSYAFESSRIESATISDSVKSIGYRAFAWSKKLKKVTMGDGVETLGKDTFKCCEKLSEIKLSSKLKKIPERTFYGCGKLKSITIPASVNKIGSYAFYCCESLENVVIENGVKTIGDHAFYYCNALKSLDFPSSMKNISPTFLQDTENIKSISVDPANKYFSSENGVLFNKNKTELVKYPAGKEDTTYTIPSTVKTIGSYAFEEVSKLKELIIPESVTAIKERAFDCASIPTLKLPSSITKIGKAAFKNCRAEKIELSKSVTEIGEEAFYSCNRLESFTVPENVKTIGRRAFDECKNLLKIYIPASVKTIKPFAFEPYRADLKEVHITDLSAWCAIDFQSESSNPLYCDTADLYLNGQKVTDLVIPEGVTKISDYAFAKSYGGTVKSVKLPSTLKSIGAHAFEGNYNIKSLTVPSSVESIGEYAFSECNLSEKIKLSKGLKTIGKNAFADTKIKKVTIPDGVTAIGERAFSYCRKLENVYISKTVMKIGSRAFDECDSLSKIKVNAENKNYKTLKGVLFNKKMTSLIKYPENKSESEYEIPKSVTKICDYAFYGVKNLTKVQITNGVKTIGDRAFAYSLKIKTITLPSSVKSIGERSFSCMKQLKTVKLSNSIKNIPDYAFESSRKLKNVTFPSSLATIGEGAFQDTALEKIKLPVSVYSIGSFAFGGCWKLKDAEFPAGIGNSLGHIGLAAEWGDWDYYEDAKVSDLTIRGYKGSSAETYAKANGFKFVALKSHTHKYEKTRTVPATQKAKGSECKYCTVCGKNKVTATIARIKSVKIANANLTYNGKVQTPTFIIKDTNGKKLKAGTDYTVTCSQKCKYVGKYEATVTFKGKYSGEKTVAFSIIPKSTDISSLKADKESITVNWTAQKSQTTGYEIRYSTSKKMTYAETITVDKKSANSVKLEKLDSGVKYYVQIRTYKTDYDLYENYNDKNITSPWSEVKSVTVK